MSRATGDRVVDQHEAEQIIRQLHAYQIIATSSRDQAIAALHRAGLVTKAGEPTPPYERHVPRCGSTPAH